MAFKTDLVILIMTWVALIAGWAVYALWNSGHFDDKEPEKVKEDPDDKEPYDNTEDGDPNDPPPPKCADARCSNLNPRT